MNGGIKIAYLGKPGGPKLSEILERYRGELLAMRRRFGCGSSTLNPQTVENLISREKEEEERGIVAAVKIPKGPGVKPHELIYIGYDLKTNSQVELYYTLTEYEKKLLGDDYKSEEVRVVSPEQARIDHQRREEMMGSGEFPIFGSND